MIDLSLIGIGTGNPDHVTLEAVRVLNGSDIILIPCKGNQKSDLVDLRRLICSKLLNRDSHAKIIEFNLPSRENIVDYIQGVESWHDEIANLWVRHIKKALPFGGRVAFMIWGDPTLYDSSLRIANRLSGMGIDAKVNVVPGITSLQVLTAQHKIPLNTLAEPILITTGRRIRELGWPQGVESLIVMLDSGCAFDEILQDNIEIWWGAYLGMEKQSLINGLLSEVSGKIRQERTNLRNENGWIMDIYLMRKKSYLEPS